MKILVAGDFCPLNRTAIAFEKTDYASVLSEVRSITSEADYSIVNLECPIVKPPRMPIKKSGPNLHCSIKGLEAIKYAGFNCVTLANNHFLDYGRGGVTDTIEACKALGIDYVGGGNNLEEASLVVYKEIQKQRIAIINCCEHEFSIATTSSPGSNPLNPIMQYYAIQKACKNANRVIVIVHGGHEHFQLPSMRMVQTYRFFIDAGADAVINHHQHCFSGYEMYHGKPIFYGLGNFCFDNPDQHNDKWNKGFTVTIDFSSIEPTFSLNPYKQCAEYARVELLPRKVYDDEIKRINKIINDPEALQKAIDHYYNSCVFSTSNLFEPSNNRFFIAAKRRGLIKSFISTQRRLKLENHILCESHRDKVSFWFNHFK